MAGSPLTLPAGPEREGYIFVGWYLGDTLYEATVFPQENITLTARFTPDLSRFEEAREALSESATPDKQFAALSEAQRVLAYWGGDPAVLPEDDRNLYERVLAAYTETRTRSLSALAGAETHAESWLSLDLGEQAPVAALPTDSEKRRYDR